MSSLVYFKFKASVKTDSIPFEGSVISVKDLKNGIRTKCCLYSQDFDLKLEDTTGKIYEKDEELIPKYASITVRRVPKLNNEGNKKKPNIYDTSRKDSKTAPVTSEVSGSNHLNLATSNLPEDEKIKMMMEKSSEIYNEKNYTVKAKPYNIPPPNYVCHKCGKSGHWIHTCPGVQDISGKMIDLKSVKRPTGIPQDFLLEVNAGTPGAYLSKTGSYMVPIKDAEAYAQGKKDKIPFSIEENPPYVAPEEKRPHELLICPLCSNMLKDAVVVSCCGTTYCNDCVVGHVFDTQIKGTGKCPNCSTSLTCVESSVFENKIVRKMVQDWINENVSSQTNNENSSDAIKTFINNRRILKPKQAIQSDVENNNSKSHETDDPLTNSVGENNFDENSLETNIKFFGTSVNNNNILTSSNHSSSSSTTIPVPFNKQTLLPTNTAPPMIMPPLMPPNGGLACPIVSVNGNALSNIMQSRVGGSFDMFTGSTTTSALGGMTSLNNSRYKNDSRSSTSRHHHHHHHRRNHHPSIEDLMNPPRGKILSKEEFERLKRELIESRRHRKSRSRSRSPYYERRHKHRYDRRRRSSDRSISRDRRRRKNSSSRSRSHGKSRNKHISDDGSRSSKVKDRTRRKSKSVTAENDKKKSSGPDDQNDSKSSKRSRSPHAQEKVEEEKTEAKSVSPISSQESQDDTTSDVEKKTKEHETRENGEVTDIDEAKKHKKSKKHRTPEEKEAKRLRKLARQEKRLAKTRKKALKLIQSA